MKTTAILAFLAWFSTCWDDSLFLHTAVLEKDAWRQGRQIVSRVPVSNLG